MRCWTTWPPLPATGRWFGCGRWCRSTPAAMLSRCSAGSLRNVTKLSLSSNQIVTVHGYVSRAFRTGLAVRQGAGHAGLASSCWGMRHPLGSRPAVAFSGSEPSADTAMLNAPPPGRSRKNTLVGN